MKWVAKLEKMKEQEGGEVISLNGNSLNENSIRKLGIKSKKSKTYDNSILFHITNGGHTLTGIRSRDKEIAENTVFLLGIVARDAESAGRDPLR